MKNLNMEETGIKLSLIMMAVGAIGFALLFWELGKGFINLCKKPFKKEKVGDKND